MSNGFFSTHASLFDEVPKCLVSDAEHLNKLNEDVALPFVLNNQIVCPVSGLSLAIRPATIGGLVSFAVVDSVDRVRLTGGSAHVGQEILKAVQPSIAYANTSSPVKRVCGGGRHCAAPDHMRPYLVFTAVAHAVFYALGLVVLFSKAAARRGHAANDGRCGNIFRASAVANALPVGRALLALGFLKDKPTTKAFAGKVYQFHFDTSKEHRKKCQEECGVIHSFGSYPIPAGLILSRGIS
jgi:hypothetical protein